MPEREIRSGMTIGHFTVDRVIATRPGLDMFLEAHGPSGGPVVLTVLDGALTDDPERLRATLRQIRIRASLKHPNLLPLRGPRRADGIAYYVTPLVSTTTLADRLAAGPMSPSDALRLVGQLAAALELAASKGLFHHDLTPSAIALKRGGAIHALLGDFAVTSPSGPACDRLAATGGVAYASPEELRGKPAREPSAVYTLGCMLVECLTGAPPFPGERPLLTIGAHLSAPAPRVSERREDLPAGLDAVIARALAKQPGERYRRPSQLVAAVERALTAAEERPAIPAAPPEKSEQEPAVRPAPERRRDHTTRRPAPSRRRRISGWVGLALAISAVGGFATGSAGGAPESASPPAAAPAAPAEPAAQREQRVYYVRAVNRAVDRLAERRAKARMRLRDARRPNAQAARASALAAAYRDAPRRLAGAAPPALAGAGIVPALRDAERAHRRLAAAARQGSGTAWRAARRDAVASDRKIERALAALAADHARLERAASHRSAA